MLKIPNRHGWRGRRDEIEKIPPRNCQATNAKHECTTWEQNSERHWQHIRLMALNTGMVFGQKHLSLPTGTSFESQFSRGFVSFRELSFLQFLHIFFLSCLFALWSTKKKAGAPNLFQYVGQRSKRCVSSSSVAKSRFDLQDLDWVPASIFTWWYFCPQTATMESPQCPLSLPHGRPNLIWVPRPH